MRTFYIGRHQGLNLLMYIEKTANDTKGVMSGIINR